MRKILLAVLSQRSCCQETGLPQKATSRLARTMAP
jgi:hypothetical protein